MCEAEDEVSCAAHLAILEKELDKARPNEDVRVETKNPKNDPISSTVHDGELYCKNHRQISMALKTGTGKSCLKKL